VSDHNQILPNTDELGTALDTSPSDMSDGVQIARLTSKYRLVGYSLLAVLLGPFSLWLWRQFGTSDDFSMSLDKLSYLPLAGALLLLVTAWCSRLVRIRYIFRPVAGDIGWKEFTMSYFAGVFISNITPSAVGGYPFFLFLLQRQGISLGKSLAVSLLDSVNAVLSLLIIAGVLLFGSIIPLAETWLWATVLMMLITIVLVLVPILFPKTLRRFVLSLSQKHGNHTSSIATVVQRALKELTRLEDITRYYWRYHRRLLLSNLVLSLVYWLAFLGVAPLLLWSVGASISWPVVIGSQVATHFAGYLIPTPGAAGGSEVTMGWLLHTQLPEERLILFLGLWRLTTYYLSLILSSLTMPWALRCMRKGAPHQSGNAH